MFRSALFAAVVLAFGAVAAGAQERRMAEEERSSPVDAPPALSRDRFVIAGDECGASHYQHLLGREYARVYQAALLPADAIVQNRDMLRTLEYTPHRLNVVLGGEGRIIAIGCF